MAGMRITSHMKVHGLGSARESAQLLPPSNNHAKSSALTKVASEVRRMGLIRVAGNSFINPSNKDFWSIKGDKVVRITTVEVDNGEKMDPTPVDHPQDFLNAILDEISF